MAPMFRQCALGVLLLAVPTLLSTPLAAQVMAATSAEAAESNQQFTGWGFGAGLSLTYDTGSHDRIEEAVIDVNGVVRVNKKNNARARIMLETHYFFPYEKNPDPLQILRAGWGPFVAVQPGDGEIINAVGIGVMFGWRRADSSDGQASRASFNLGIGYAVDPKTKVLGDEFEENQPAPLGPDGNPIPIRLSEIDQGGILLLASFTW